MWVHLGAMLVYLESYVGRSWGLCWAKRAEKWEQQKITVKRRIFWRSAAYLGAMLAHLGAMLAYLEGNVGPSWELCWPILGLCWPILGLCWPILGPILGVMLSHLGGYVAPSWDYVRPSWGLRWPTLSHRLRKRRKKRKSKMPCKTQDILAGGSGSAAGGAAPLSYGEERTAVRQGHGQGAPGRIYEAYAWQPGAGKSRPVSPSRVWIRPRRLTSWARLRLPRPRLAPSWWRHQVVVVVVVAVAVAVVVVVVVVVVGRCWPYLGAGLPLSWP